MSPSKIETLEINPEAITPTVNSVYHGTTFIDEWEPLPELISLDVTANPTLVQQATKQELIPFESIGDKLKPLERFEASTLGILAAGSTIGREIKGRFTNVASRYHTWKYDRLEKIPEASNEHTDTTEPKPPTDNITLYFDRVPEKIITKRSKDKKPNPKPSPEPEANNALVDPDAPVVWKYRPPLGAPDRHLNSKMALRSIKQSPGLFRKPQKSTPSRRKYPNTPAKRYIKSVA